MGTEFLELPCDERGVCSDREYCSGSPVQLGRSNMFYHGASGGKYVPRAAPFDLEPGVLCARRRSASSSALGAS
jgi:tubulin beta